MNYKGVIIEESLDDKKVLNELNIVKTRVEEVTPKHKTPWLKKWTLHNVEILEDQVDTIAEKISQTISSNPSSWYADFENEKYHFIIYPQKIFIVDLSNPVLYKEAKKYGVSLGIPEYQVDFAPEDKVWER